MVTEQEMKVLEAATLKQNATLFQLTALVETTCACFATHATVLENICTFLRDKGIATTEEANALAKPNEDKLKEILASYVTIFITTMKDTLKENETPRP